MAASKTDATSVSSLDTVENLTDIDSIKAAFDKYCDEEVVLYLRPKSQSETFTHSAEMNERAEPAQP